MNKIFLILLLAFLSWNCDSFLDVAPKGKAIPTTAEDFDNMLNSTSISISNVNFMDPDVYVPDNLFIGIQQAGGNSYMWADYVYTPTQSDANWKGLYGSLYYCNYIIKNIDEAPTENDRLKTWVKGQAYAQRAHIYFWLVNLYAKHINESSMSQDLAVPLKINLPLDEKLPRATVSDIYELIESDIKIAEKLVPQNVDLSQCFKASQDGVKALKAKIELFKGNFSSALILTNELIENIGEKFNNYNEINSQKDYFNSVDKFEFYTNKEHIWYSGIRHFPSYRSEEYAHFLTTDLKNLYTDKENDLRYKFWMTDTTQDGSTYEATRFINSYRKNLTAGLSEIYLIRAECYARRGNAGDKDLAMQDVNTLRKYRFKTGSTYSLSADNASEALRIVKEERRRELIGTGLNWFDLRRYHNYRDQIPDFKRTIKGKIYELKAGSNRYVLAIPEFIRDQNPLLEQNLR